MTAFSNRQNRSCLVRLVVNGLGPGFSKFVDFRLHHVFVNLDVELSLATVHVSRVRVLVNDNPDGFFIFFPSNAHMRETPPAYDFDSRTQPRSGGVAGSEVIGFQLIGGVNDCIAS